jgi:hypothetical protein
LQRAQAELRHSLVDEQPGALVIYHTRHLSTPSSCRSRGPDTWRGQDTGQRPHRMETAPDDLLVLLFEQLVADQRASTFIWLRTTLPLVCRRFAALLRGGAAGARRLHAHVVVNAKAECAASRRAAAGAPSAGTHRSSADLASDAAARARRGPSPDPSGASVSPTPSPHGSPPPGASPLPGGSPMRGGWVGSGSPPPLMITYPAAATRAGGASPPPPGPHPGGALQHSASASRLRARLSSRRVHAWLVPRAGVVRSLALDLAGPHDFSSAALERTMAALAPGLTRLELAGSPVDAGDCCEALGARGWGRGSRRSKCSPPPPMP